MSVYKYIAKTLIGHMLVLVDEDIQITKGARVLFTGYADPNYWEHAAWVGTVKYTDGYFKHVVLDNGIDIYVPDYKLSVLI